MCAPEPVLTDDAMDAGFTNEMAADGSALIVRNLSGTWLLDECIRSWVKEDGIKNVTEFRDHLLHAAMADDVEVAGVIDCGHPDLITTSDMPNLIRKMYRGRFSSGHLDRPQLIRLILESLAASFAETVDQLAQVSGAAIDEIVMIGGGSRIEPLVELTRVTTALPVRVSYQEAASIGNIATQAVGAGLFETVEDARTLISATLKEIC